MWYNRLIDTLRQWLIALILLISLSLLALTLGNHRTIAIGPFTDENSDIEPLEILMPELIPICGCESAGSPNKEPVQFHPDGSVVRGRVNRNDIGACQINITAHSEFIIKSDLNPFEEKDNYMIANYLFATQGLKPWYSSKKCWEGAV